MNKKGKFDSLHSFLKPRKVEKRTFALWNKPNLSLQTTTLWDYPSQHYGPKEQGSQHYKGATPSYVIWNLLMRYTKEGETVLDPMCGSGTTLDVCADINRKGIGFDLSPTRSDIIKANASFLPIKNNSVDFYFLDPPYSNHIKYSNHKDCLGMYDARTHEYWQRLRLIIKEAHRVLKKRRYLGLYICDSFSLGKTFVPMGFRALEVAQEFFNPIDIIAVTRHNKNLKKSNFHKAAYDGNFFLRGFNYCLILKNRQ